MPSVFPKHLLAACISVLFFFSFFVSSPLALAKTTIKPGGLWITPDNNFTAVQKWPLLLSAHAYPTNPGDPKIAYVNFTAYWSGLTSSQWPVLATVKPTPGTDVFSYTWDLTYKGAVIPAGAFQVSFDVYDVQGNKNLAPNGVHNGTATVPSYDPGSYAGKNGGAYVDLANSTFPEPNDVAHANYCGPAASRVLIANWTNNIPSLDTMASEEKTNQGKTGTYIQDMVGPINQAIGQNYYNWHQAGSQQAFSNMIGQDILEKHHPLITGILTIYGQAVLNGWDYSGFSVTHIITIYGFDFTSPNAGYIEYYETAGTVAGTNATGPNSIDYNTFWTLVSQNDIQLS